MSEPTHRYSLFEAIGVEIELMIVDRETLAVAPVADQLFESVLGHAGSDVTGPLVTWSNELVNHVVELKTTLPTPDLQSAIEPFQQEVMRVNRHLERMGAQLMPTAMHPWMDPTSETVLFPGENSEVYQTFDRIFGCRGHGWANLQSVHLNLPFANDEEFARLHRAIRTVLPIIPALTASSPFQEGRLSGFHDTRLFHYRRNAALVPQVAGQVIPEPVASEEEYREIIFAPLMTAIAPLDPEGVLEEEWLNARGAIARFSRGSIEIRVIDSQEHPMADLAIASAVVGAVRALAEEKWTPLQSLDVEQGILVDLLERTIRDADQAMIQETSYLTCFGLRGSLSAGQVWRHITQSLVGQPGGIDRCFAPMLETIHSQGPLARRLIASAKNQDLPAIYRRLSEGLNAGSALRD